MADRTLVNGQISDAVAQAGVTALANAPAQALATDYQMGAHAIGLAMQNATANQRQSTTLSTGTTTQAVTQILSLAPSVSARATVETFTGSNLLCELASLSAAIQAMRRRNSSGRQGLPVAGAMPPIEEDRIGPTPGINAIAGQAAEPAAEAKSAIGHPTAPAPGINDVVGQLADNIARLASTIRTLAATRTGEPSMHDPQALAALRAAADRLNELLAELAKHMASLPSPDIWQRLSNALDELRSATRALEGGCRLPFHQAPPVPVGATPNPNVTIVGSGNTTDHALRRIVGASW